MSSRSSPPANPSAPRLPVVGAPPAQTVCPSNQWLWEEEIALVRAMRAVKLEVRAARERGDEGAIARLRAKFKELDARREKVRRERLDSLGHLNYD